MFWFSHSSRSMKRRRGEGRDLGSTTRTHRFMRQLVPQAKLKEQVCSQPWLLVWFSSELVRTLPKFQDDSVALLLELTRAYACTVRRFVRVGVGRHMIAIRP